MDDPKSPERRSKRGPAATYDFDAMYGSSVPPWDIGRPQLAFEEVAKSGRLVGRVLDVGCGTGEHALLAATLGHDAFGVDIAPRAIEQARTKAIDRGIDVQFLIWDALRLSELGEQFDTALDCGLFHILDDADRARFVHSLGTVVPRGGVYRMLCFSDRQPGEGGPRRIAQEEIRTSFADGWNVDSIDPAVIEVTYDPSGALAWHAAITRT